MPFYGSADNYHHFFDILQQEKIGKQKIVTLNKVLCKVFLFN